MTRFAPLAATLLLGATLAACGGDDPVAATTETFTATNVAVSNAVDLAGRCAPDLTLNIEGTGNSNLGAVTIRLSHCFNPQGPNALAFSDGQFIYTFVDGNTFSGTYSGASLPTGSPGAFGIQAQWEVTSGTGIYSGATGSGTAAGQANNQTGEGTVTLQGTITR